MRYSLCYVDGPWCRQHVSKSRNRGAQAPVGLPHILEYSPRPNNITHTWLQVMGKRVALHGHTLLSQTRELMEVQIHFLLLLWSKEQEHKAALCSLTRFLLSFNIFTRLGISIWEDSSINQASFSNFVEIRSAMQLQADIHIQTTDIHAVPHYTPHSEGDKYLRLTRWWSCLLICKNIRVREKTARLVGDIFTSTKFTMLTTLLDEFNIF